MPIVSFPYFIYFLECHSFRIHRKHLRLPNIRSRVLLRPWKYHKEDFFCPSRMDYGRSSPSWWWGASYPGFQGPLADLPSSRTGWKSERGKGFLRKAAVLTFPVAYSCGGGRRCRPGPPLLFHSLYFLLFLSPFLTLFPIQFSLLLCSH